MVADRVPGFGSFGSFGWVGWVGRAFTLCCSALSLTGAVEARALGAPATLRERVECRAVVEDVYWSRRLWPEANRGLKPPRAEVLPMAVIAERVEEALRYEAALETVWGRTLSGAALQSELERQTRSTRDPEGLRSLWRALGDDPARVAECLVRPELAERLVRDAFAHDPSPREAFESDRSLAAEFADSDSFDDWWSSTRSRFAPVVPSSLASAAGYRMAGMAGLAALSSTLQTNAPDREAAGCVPGTWRLPRGLTPPPVGREDFIALWTGSEMLVWGGRYVAAAPAQGARYDPATDTWKWMRLPEGESDPGTGGSTAVWTGTEMIVWGGWTRAGSTNRGAIYDPARDTWRPTSTGPNVPTARQDHAAVWTGTEMAIWGGMSGGGGQTFFSTGARYDPVANQWTPMSSSAAPAGRNRPHIAWTGSSVLVWGGVPLAGSGGLYTPATDSWRAIGTGPGNPGGRAGDTAVWSGSELIVWGGTSSSNGTLEGTGAAYSPSTNQWRTIPAAPGSAAPRTFHSVVWTGNQMIVWGGYGAGNQLLADGARLESRGVWRPLSVVGAPSPRFNQEAVWTGSQMVVWGGKSNPTYNPETYPRSGGRYDLATDRWLGTDPGPNAPIPRARHTAVWTGIEMIVWGGDAVRPTNTGGRYVPSTDSWFPTNLTNAPAPRSEHTAVWTGGEMVVWGGADLRGPIGTGGRYSPTRDSWTPTPQTAQTPSARHGHTTIWTGAEMIVWGGSAFAERFNSGARFSPAQNTWTTTSTGPGVPTPRRAHTAVFTGKDMIVWGGSNTDGPLGDGARYDLASDRWAPVSTEGPSAREGHTAVWASEADQMIVYGGWNAGPLGTGGRFDPARDSWLKLEQLGAPEARTSHTAVWTGHEMLVWGGTGDTWLRTGGGYAPSNDSWRALSTTSTPDARRHHTAVFTGNEMVIWGGQNAALDVLDSGGRFCVSGVAEDAAGNTAR